MTYEIYRNIYIIGEILAGILFAGAVVLFFVFRIPKIIGDLTGRNAKKAIYGIKMKNRTTPLGRQENTMKINKKNQSVITEALIRDNGTGEETAVLSSSGEETAVLSSSGEETAVLSPSGDETMVLSSQEDTVLLQSAPFTPDTDITYIHTNEVID